MTKQEFLRKLEKKLEILSVEEREDTINEYSDIIDEKMKHGKTEEEAVKEAGDVNELAKEIIKAYKINPDYKKTNKSFAEGAEDAIKKGAKKLSEVTEEVVDNIKNSDFEFTTENVFELIIKIILVLFGLAFLKIPFYIVESLVTSIFGFGGFGSLTSFLFKFIIELAYLVICILIILNLINKYTSKNVKKEVKEEKTIEKETNIKEEKVTKKDNKITCGDVVLLIVKIFAVICFVIPLISLIVAFSVLIALIIYLIFKGIYAYGILILIIGLLSFCGNFVSLILGIMNKKNIHFYPFVISFIITLIGCFMTIDYVSSFTFINKIDESRYNVITKKYEEEINKETQIYYLDELRIDNTLPDNKIIIEAIYSDEYIGINMDRYDSTNLTRIVFTKDIINKVSINKNILEDIKNKTIYDYELLGDARIVVYVNEATSKYVN